MSTTLHTTQTDNTRRNDVPSGKGRRSLFALLRYSRDIDRRLDEELRLMNEVLEETKSISRK